MYDDESTRMAADRAEYDEAVSIVRWLREKARERFARGHNTSASLLAIASENIAENFLPPPGK